ncbi:MAG TPA: outer membrane beta-barrel protein [Terriglobales bacterium]|nr:outer membrane beta-barrel protein [Terriglobales bacterium]
MRNVLATLALLVLACACTVAQEAPKFNFNIGGGPTWPVQSISDFATMSGNFVVGGGINLSKVFGVNAEYMYNNLPPKQGIVALTNATDGNARLQSVTGNLILHAPEKSKLGGYAIGGTGWYHRSWDLTNPALTVGTVCLPSYVWWGIACTNGLVSTNVTVASGSDNAIGWNIGGGLTYRLGESHAKFYTELRYHVAYTKGVNTDVLPWTFGIRF